MPVPASEAGNDYTPYATNRAPKASNSALFPRWQLLRQIQLPADQQVGFNSMRVPKQGNMSPFLRPEPGRNQLDLTCTQPIDAGDPFALNAVYRNDARVYPHNFHCHLGRLLGWRQPICWRSGERLNRVVATQPAGFGGHLARHRKDGLQARAAGRLR